jgi:hypothetical protein
VSSATEQAPLLYAPARIVGRRMGAPVDADLQRINSLFAAVPLTADDLFTFDAVASTDAVDTYFTHMDTQTTLPNYRDDLGNGQGLLDSHDIYELPLGSSFRAELQPITEAEGAPATLQVLTGYYLVRGLTVNRKATDDYIRGIETGTQRKMSIGFGGVNLRYICDIDGSDMFDWKSDYYPGMRLYDGTIVTYAVVDARAMETSLVSKNSTPGAVIQRIQALVDQRHIDPKEVLRLEQCWGVRFAGKSTQFFVSEGAGRMPQPNEQRLDARAFLQGIHERVGKKISAATRDKLGSAVSRLGDAAGGIQEASDAIAALLEEVDAEAEAGRMVRTALGDQATAEGIAVLRADASAGKVYRADLVKETVQARVAVAGDAFDAKRYETRLASYDVEDLRDEYEAWSGKRSKVFKSGRQVPVEDPETPSETLGLVIEERDV